MAVLGCLGTTNYYYYYIFVISRFLSQTYTPTFRLARTLNLRHVRHALQVSGRQTQVSMLYH